MLRRGKRKREQEFPGDREHGQCRGKGKGLVTLGAFENAIGHHITLCLYKNNSVYKCMYIKYV